MTNRRAGAGLRLTDAEVRRVRLGSQLLSGETAHDRSVEDVVCALVGVQAQDTTAAALAVRCRGGCRVAADVVRARTDRDVVLTWSLRGTRHLHRADDVRWMVALLGPRFLRSTRRAEQLGIAGPVGEGAMRALRDALAAEGPLSRDDVKARLAPHGVDPSGQAAIHVVGRAALEGLLCVLPGERYVLLDDWLSPPEDDVTDPEQAAKTLVTRYLAAYGPATPADFAAWSGLGMPTARRAWAGIADDLVEVEHPAGPSWLLAADADRAAAAAADTAADGADADAGEAAAPDGRSTGVRLLGAFDSLLLAYADRRLHLSPDHAPLVNRGGGMVKPLLVIDGRVTGTWARPGGSVEVHPFRPLTVGESAAVEDEAADVVRFLRPDPSPGT